MLLGWWKVTDMEELKALVNALHSRGIRERALQKQLQKSMELIAQTCNKNREGEHHVPVCVFDLTDLAMFSQQTKIKKIGLPEMMFIHHR